MRRPFIFILALLSTYCWFKDFINFLFYLFHNPGGYKDSVGTITAMAATFVVAYLLRKYLQETDTRPIPGECFPPSRSKEWLFLLLVSLPVIVLGLFRSIFPDQNFDTFHFELYLQEYDFPDNKMNFGAGSIRTYYFPLAERIFALCRHTMGFRLGAFFNTFILIALIASVYDLLKKILLTFKPAFRYPVFIPGLLALFIVTADNTMFNIGSYKPDILGVPLLLEMIHVVLFEEKTAKKSSHFYFFLVASLTLALKLTYLPYVGILTLVYYIRHFREYRLPEKILLPLLLLAVPSIYLLYNQLETGNPIFPFFNKLFHSPLYPLANFKDERFGPHALYEIFIYPFVTFFDPQRCNEYSLYSYRLLFGYVISWATFIFCGLRLKNGRPGPWRYLFYLSALALLFDYSCVVTTGYYRYGIIVEVLYGAILSIWLFYLQKKWILVVVVLVIAFQSFDTVTNIYIKNRNLSWHDYKGLIHNRENLRANAGLLLHDYGSDSIPDPDKILPRIDYFINMDPSPYDGLSRLLNKNAPIYDIGFQGRTADSVSKFERNIVWPLTKSKEVMVATYTEPMMSGMIRSLNNRGYMVENIHEVYPTFMKYGEPVFLLKVKYMDTVHYNIKFTEQYLRDENTPETRQDFSYQSPYTFKAFIREAPFAFDWNFLNPSYDLFLNDQKLTTNDRFKNNKIFTITSNHLKIHKTSNVPYLIMFQETIEKP